MMMPARRLSAASSVGRLTRSKGNLGQAADLLGHPPQHPVTRKIATYRLKRTG